jgi:hypothetical protein
MPAWENLDEFFSTDDFALLATLTPTNGAPRSVRGIFDAQYVNTQIGEYEAGASEPRFTCKASDVIGIKRGAAMLTIPGVGRFDVLHEPEGDGTGQAILRLAPENA